MQIIHHLTIDMARQLPVLPIGAVQGDANTRAVEISLLENGEPWNAPDGITAAVAFRKPDRTKGLYDRLPDGAAAVAVNGSTVAAILAPQVLSCAGEVRAAVVFHDADLNQLATFPFTLRVAANPAAGQSVSNDYYRYCTMEAVSAAVDGFLAKAEEALQVVHDTATADAPAIVCDGFGESITVSDAADRPLQGLTLCGKTVQNGTPTPQSPVEPESAGASGSIGVTVAGKNLLRITETTRTVNGVTFTVNPDGSVVANGTATETIWFHIGTVSLTAGIEYRLTGCPGGGGDNAPSLYYLYDDGKRAFDYGTGITFTPAEGHTTENLIIMIVTGQTAKNLVFYPMIRSASIADDTFEPYKGQTLAAYTPDGLPGIPVSSGGNYTDENGQAWVCDEVDFARGVYAQRVGVIDFGNENTQILDRYSTGTSGKYRFHLAEDAMKLSENGILAPSFCNVTAPATSTNQWLHDKDGVAYYKTGALDIYLEEISTMTLAQAQEWMRQKGVKVQYILEAPTETPLSAGELAAFAALHSNKPNTTVFNDGGAGMKLSYVADTKTYIGRKLAAISAALLGA